MKCQNICELCQLFDEIRKIEDCFSERKVARQKRVKLEHRRKGKKIARRESRRWLDEHQK